MVKLIITIKASTNAVHQKIDSEIDDTTTSEDLVALVHSVKETGIGEGYKTVITDICRRLGTDPQRVLGTMDSKPSNAKHPKE